MIRNSTALAYMLMCAYKGGSFNNIMWASDDCDYIEFNLMPDDLHITHSHGKTHVRHVFLAAAWAKGGSGKFWIIEPTMQHKTDFYLGNMRISPRDVVHVLTHIADGSLLRPDARPYQDYPIENKSVFGGLQ